MSANFSKGDRVRAVGEISGGFLKSNVKSGTRGVVVGTSMLGRGLRVDFDSAGLLWLAVVLDDVQPESLEKRR